ncbi:MATE family efflux transporter [Vibrio caribbeanicus]|uniref:MATE family efflux transporter n=1 Tax=Vibrio caribbeanicus TaxID=701175 RepID=UPI0030D8B3AB
MKLTHKEYLKIAIPFVVSTVTQPLLGAVDTAVIGRLCVTELLGGIAIGTLVMNTIYWLFGFFRVSTTGQSAMALGSNNSADQINSLLRPAVLAAFVGLVFILLQGTIWQVAEWGIAPDPAVSQHAKAYFDIMIFGAPFVLVNYTLIGWLMGQEKARETLIIQVMGNVLNMALDILFVLYFDMGIAGVAAATLIAQVATLLLGITLVLKTGQFSLVDHLKSLTLSRGELKVILSSNIDLLLRTVCLLVFFNIVARVGSQLGTDVLATNAIFLQVVYVMSYLFDGIANASSVFAGKAVGQKNPKLLDSVICITAQYTMVLIVALTLLTFIFERHIVSVFTSIPELIELCLSLSTWLLIFPLFAGFGLTFYGIFTGTGTTRPVRNASFMTLVVFLLVQLVSVPNLGNDGLWLSFTLFYVGRFAFMYPYIGQVRQKCL